MPQIKHRFTSLQLLAVPGYPARAPALQAAVLHCQSPACGQGQRGGMADPQKMGPPLMVCREAAVVTAQPLLGHPAQLPVTGHHGWDRQQEQVRACCYLGVSLLQELPSHVGSNKKPRKRLQIAFLQQTSKRPVVKSRRQR